MMLISTYKITDDDIIFMGEKQEIFIQIIDRYRNDRCGSLYLSLIAKERSNGVIASANGALYIDGIKDHYLASVAAHLNTRRIYSMYGKTKELDKLSSKITLPVDLQLEYYVMTLARKEFQMTESQWQRGSEVTARFCEVKDFEYLKKLQYQYHLEEVYDTACSYPYSYEMHAFKLLLKSRDCFAVFVNEEPVSKAYINASSYDTLQLGGIFTQKEYRQQGYAQHCVTRFIHALFAKYPHITTIQLFVKKKNLPAIALYKKIGFTVKEETTTIYYK